MIHQFFSWLFVGNIVPLQRIIHKPRESKQQLCHNYYLFLPLPFHFSYAVRSIPLCIGDGRRKRRRHSQQTSPCWMTPATYKRYSICLDRWALWCGSNMTSLCRDANQEELRHTRRHATSQTRCCAEIS